MASLVFDRGIDCHKITYSNNVKLFQQCSSVKAKNVEMEATSFVRPSVKAKNVEMEATSFVEEPVLFNFGDDYGNKLFLDSKEEVMWNNFNTLVYVRQSPKLRFNVEPSWKKYSDDPDVYKFSSVEDIIHSFFKHN